MVTVRSVSATGSGRVLKSFEMPGPLTRGLELPLAAKDLKFGPVDRSHKSAKNLSHLGRWDGNFPRPTFLEAGGTDFLALIS
jgi:hypothetical protein